MDTMAFINQKELFDQFDKMASYATLSDADRMAYDADLKAYRDLRGQLEYAEARGEARGELRGEARGEARGIKKGKSEIIIEMARQGFSLDMISKVAKMTADKVKQILSSPDSY